MERVVQNSIRTINRWRPRRANNPTQKRRRVFVDSVETGCRAANQAGFLAVSRQAPPRLIIQGPHNKQTHRSRWLVPGNLSHVQLLVRVIDQSYQLTIWASLKGWELRICSRGQLEKLASTYSPDFFTKNIYSQPSTKLAAPNSNPAPGMDPPAQNGNQDPP
jgi:hypothetical protein